MSQKWVAMGFLRMRCPMQSEKANLPVFLTQSLLEVEARSSGGIRELCVCVCVCVCVWWDGHPHCEWQARKMLYS
jgi:hypothetical protein